MVSYSELKSSIIFRYVEIKNCGANSPGGGGFRSGNTCARGGGSFSIPDVGRSSSVALGGTETLSNERLVSKFNEVGGAVEEIGKGGLHGFYDPSSKKIYLDESLPKTSEGIVFGKVTVDGSLEGRFKHEYAHHVWRNELSVAEKKEWSKTYGKVKPDYWRAQISSKAAANAEEAFAEMYTVFTSKVALDSQLRGHKEGWKVFEKLMKPPSISKGR